MTHGELLDQVGVLKEVCPMHSPWSLIFYFFYFLCFIICFLLLYYVPLQGLNLQLLLVM